MNGMNWSDAYHIEANDMFIEYSKRKKMNINGDEYERSCLIEHPKQKIASLNVCFLCARIFPYAEMLSELCALYHIDLLLRK